MASCCVFTLFAASSLAVITPLALSILRVRLGQLRRGLTPGLFERFKHRAALRGDLRLPILRPLQDQQPRILGAEQADHLPRGGVEPVVLNESGEGGPYCGALARPGSGHRVRDAVCRRLRLAGVRKELGDRGAEEFALALANGAEPLDLREESGFR